MSKSLNPTLNQICQSMHLEMEILAHVFQNSLAYAYLYRIGHTCGNSETCSKPPTSNISAIVWLIFVPKLLHLL